MVLEVPQFYFGLPNLCDPLRGFGKLRWLGFSLTLHCSALFNHNQKTLFCSVYSGLQPIYATQSHHQTLLSTYTKPLRSAKRRSSSESQNARSSFTNRKWIFTCRKTKIIISPFTGVLPFSCPKNWGPPTAFSVAEGVSEHSVVKIFTRLRKAKLFKSLR